MRTALRLALVLTIAAVATVPAQAAEGGELDAVHHTADGNYLDFLPFTKIELPRLFLVRGTDGALRLEAFWTSTAAVESGRYAIVGEAGGYGEAGQAGAEPGVEDAEPGGADSPSAVQEEIEEATAEELLGEQIEAEAAYDAKLAPADGEIVVDFSITRHLVWALLAIGIVLALFLPMAGKYRRGIGRETAPRGTYQNLMEIVVIYVRDEIAKPNIGDKYGRFMPYLLAVFFFILVSNLIGLVPFGATATGNIMTTAVLAIITFIVTQVAGTKDYWLHIFWPPGVPAFVKPILIPIEILGLFTKPFALAVRLFANMAAGHLVILNLIGLIFLIGAINTTAGWITAVPAVLLTAGVYLLKVLVAFIQAYVFTLLSALFIGMATAEHEHDHDHSEDHGLDAHDLALHQSAPLVNGAPHKKEHERTVGTEAALAYVPVASSS